MNFLKRFNKFKQEYIKLYLCLITAPLIFMQCQKDNDTKNGTFSYSPSSATYTSSATGSGTSVAPVFTNGTVGWYYVPNGTSLPSGASIDKTTGVISWSGLMKDQIDTIIVKNTNSDQSVIYYLTVSNPAVSYTPSSIDAKYKVSPTDNQYHISDTSSMPVFNKGTLSTTVGTYSIVSILLDNVAFTESSITIDPTTGVIRWTDNVKSGKYVIKVANSSNPTNTVLYTLNIPKAPYYYATDTSYFVSGTTDATQTSEQPINATSSNAPVYKLKSISPTTSNVVVASSSGVITWQDPIARGEYSVIVTATNAAGVAYDFTYTLKVKQAASFSYSTNSATFVKGGAEASSVTPTFSDEVSSDGVVATPTVKGKYSIVSGSPSDGTVKIDETTGVIKWSGKISAGTYEIIVKNEGSPKNVIYTLKVTASQ